MSVYIVNFAVACAFLVLRTSCSYLTDQKAMLFCALDQSPCAFGSTEIIIITTLIYKRLRPLFSFLNESIYTAQIMHAREWRYTKRMLRVSVLYKCNAILPFYIYST